MISHLNMIRASAIRSWILGVLLCSAATALRPIEAGAQSASETLRQYLNARMQGDIETARGLWDRKEVRRSQSMSTRYEAIEARFDDYLLLSSEERQELAASTTFVLVDSLIDGATAHFSVRLQDRSSGQERDLLRYLLQKEAGAWKISLPLVHDSRGWTRREGRFFRLRSKRLRHVNQEALSVMDASIEEMLERFGTPPAARLRLERMKLEYFLCENEADIRNLLGAAEREGYLPGSERIVTRQLADLNAVTRAIVNLTLRKTPPHGAPFFEEGLAVAFGGQPDATGSVLLQRASARVANDATLLETALESAAPDHVEVAALWCAVLLEELGPESFMALYRELRGTAASAGNFTASDVLEAVEKATGKSREALLAWLRAKSADFPGPVRAGCENWPEETRTTRALLRWQDSESGWAMRGYLLGEDYVFAMGALETGLPKWFRQQLDSLRTARGVEAEAPEDSVEVQRPEGDPPYVSLLLRPRIRTQSDPFDSPLFAQHFFARPYVNEQFGIFINMDEVRVYDYRRGVLVAEYSQANAPPGGRTFYDRETARLCFSLQRDLFPKDLLDYDVMGFPYTGE